MRILSSLVAIGLAAVAAAPAAALGITYSAFAHYPGSVLSLSTVHLSLTFASATNAFGGHTVTGISGDVDGDAIVGLLPLNGPSQCTCFSQGYDYGDGVFALSDTVYDSGPITDHGGLGYRSATQAYDFWNTDGRGTYEVDAVLLGTTLSDLFAGTAPFSSSIGGVPEPASWTLMIAGFALTGAMVRRRAVATVAA